jgi:hypothetical protein
MELGQSTSIERQLAGLFATEPFLPTCCVMWDEDDLAGGKIKRGLGAALSDDLRRLQTWGFHQQFPKNQGNATLPLTRRGPGRANVGPPPPSRFLYVARRLFIRRGAPPRGRGYTTS